MYALGQYNWQNSYKLQQCSKCKVTDTQKCKVTDAQPHDLLGGMLTQCAEYLGSNAQHCRSAAVESPPAEGFA